MWAVDWARPDGHRAPGPVTRTVPWPPSPARQPLIPESPPVRHDPSRGPVAQYAELLVPSPDLTVVPPDERAARYRPMLLLSPRHQIVPFTGRTGLLGDFADWMSGAGAPAFRLLHGAGGQGKTRLIREVAAGCAGTGWAVWQAGHPKSTATGRAKIDCGVLVLVDHADRWPFPALITLLGQAHRVWLGSGMTVRVLLAARSAGDWWAAVTDRTATWGAATDARELPPLTDDVAPANLFDAAAEHFAAAMGVPPLRSAVPDLTGPAFAPVLAVHLAALAAVDAGRHGRRPPQDPADISAYLLSREHDHQQRLARDAAVPVDPTTLRRATWTAALTGPLPPDTATRALATVRLTDTAPADRILAAHAAGHPPEDPDQRLEPPRPDPLAEDLVALALADTGNGAEPAVQDSDWATAALPALLADADGTPHPWSGTTLTVLVEAAHRWPHVRDALAALIRDRPHRALAAGGATLARLAAIPGLDTGVLAAVEPLLPDERHRDRHVDGDMDLDIGAAAVTGALVRHRLGTATDPCVRGALHRRLSDRLSDVGQPDRALAEARSAVREYRRSPEPARAGLAAALLSLHHRLSTVKKRDEAVAVGQEAVAEYRDLVDTVPGQRPYLAEALGSLGAELSQVDRPGEAADAIGAAVREYRRLPDPDRSAGMASALVNWAVYTTQADLPDGALEATEEATAIYRRLSDADPERYQDYFALTLAQYADRLAGAGRDDEALAAAEESVEIFRRLAAADPSQLHPASACQQRLIVRLIRMDRDAVPVLTEAVRQLRQLYRTDPDTYRSLLATVVSLLADRSAGAAPTRALTYREEAVRLHRRLVDKDPDTRLPGLAAALTKLAGTLSTMKQRDESLTAEREAVGIYRTLATGGADDIVRFAAAATTLAGNLAAANRRAESTDLLDEAVGALRRVAEPSADSRLLLAQTMFFLAVALRPRGDRDRALTLLDEAIDILVALPGKPARAEVPLARARELRARIRTELGRYG